MKATSQQADAIGVTISSQLQRQDADAQIAGMEVTEMADGSGQLAILTTTVDQHGHEHEVRVIVDRHGNRHKEVLS